MYCGWGLGFGGCDFEVGVWWSLIRVFEVVGWAEVGVKGSGV